ncbi:MAG: GDP-L-fucose synthase family protein [Nitrospinales bacterium]
MTPNRKIFIAGSTGMVGSAIVNGLKRNGYENLILTSHSELNLENQALVNSFFEKERPEYVFLAAAKVGGILANNTYRAEFIFNNLIIQTNVIHAAWKFGVKRLLFLGSSCIYPRDCPQPMKEEHLLSGPLEPTNEPYAVAKIAGLKMCEAYNQQYGTDFISVMPTNLYGENDNFDLESSHVIPAILRKVVEAKISGDANVTIWGSGEVKREFMHVNDLASACIFLMEKGAIKNPINIGAGDEITIKELAQLICKIVGFDGELRFDESKPDGMPRKLLDTSQLQKFGWRAGINLEEGLGKTYQWYMEHHIKPVINKNHAIHREGI